MKQIILILSLLISTSAFSQLDEEKEMYKDLVKNADYTWIYQTRLYEETPKELVLFFEKMNKEVIKGDVDITDLNNQKILKNDLLKMLNRIDTVTLLDPITLQTHEKYQTFNGVNSAGMWLNEVWYFNEQTKVVESSINYFTILYNSFDLNKKHIGLQPMYRKMNNSNVSKNTKQVTVNRIIKMDSVGYNQFPIKMLFDESLNDKLINNINDFKIIDESGNVIKDNQKVIYSDEIDEVYGKTIYGLDPLGIIHLEIEEEWFLDYDNYNIKKKIIKITPITRYFPDLEGEEQQKSFSIVFE